MSTLNCKIPHILRTTLYIFLTVKTEALSLLKLYNHFKGNSSPACNYRCNHKYSYHTVNAHATSENCFYLCSLEQHTVWIPTQRYRERNFLSNQNLEQFK